MKTITGVNDLGTTDPWLIHLWDFKKNDGISPSKISRNCKKKVWWRCRKDPRHSFQAVVANMVSGRGKCKICTGHATQYGVNDLFTTDPNLEEIWDKDSNTIDPSKINRGSYSKAFWKCKTCGRTWVKSVRQTVMHPKCPYCSGRKLAPDGGNSLANAHPEVVDEWNIIRNGCDPHEIPKNQLMYNNVWWKCKTCGKSWKKQLRYYIDYGSSCPYCNGKILAPGMNDLKTLHPEAASAWDNDRNDGLSPSGVLPSDPREVYWKCKNGHSWTDAIVNEVNGGYTAGCPYCKNKKLLVGFNDLATVRPDLASEWDRDKNALTPEDVMVNSREQIWWKCAKGHEWKCSVTARAYEHSGGCAKCDSSLWSSRAEDEIFEYVKTMLPGVTVIQNDRSVLDNGSTHGSGREIDVFIPSKNMGIEYNGLHWHSTNSTHPDKNRHWSKWNALNKMGIQLIQIWEDEWINRRPIVEDMLKAKLAPGLMTRKNARSMRVVFTGKNVAADFLDGNHIQGKTSGCRYVMLVDDEGPEACMAWKMNHNVLELVRYASRLGTSCRGGLSRCLKHAISHEVDSGRQVDSVVTFSDHCVSDGAAYKALGFHVDAELPPDYMYVVGKERRHKFVYRKSRFRDDPNLEYHQDMTEAGLAELNGMDRIYDAGKTRWRLDL